MKTIKIHGQLGEKVGETFYFDVNTPAEAIIALVYQVPGFREEFSEGRYQLLSGPLEFDNENIGFRFKDRLDIVPVMDAAANGKKGGIGKTIIGAALIALSFVPGNPIAGLTLKMGIGMMTAGVTSLISPRPKLPANSTREEGKPPSMLFTGAIQTTQEGNGVPICLGGPVMCGSQVVSGGLYVESADIKTTPVNNVENILTTGDNGAFNNAVMWMSAQKGGKGGGEAHVATEAPNTLSVEMTAKLVDLISVGECFGWDDPVNPLRCYFMDETSIERDNGSGANLANFKGLEVHTRLGTPGQDAMPGFDEQTGEVDVSTIVKFGPANGVTRGIQDLSLDAVRVKLYWPAMTEANKENGDINGSTVSYRVGVRANLWADFEWTVVRTLSEKFTSPVQVAHRIELPPGEGPWDIRVERTSPDPVGVEIANEFSFYSYTRIVDAKMQYPGSAVVGTVAAAAQFGDRIPARAFLWRGIICAVPTNYDPVTRTYTGLWDGTWKRAWTNNGAWITHEVLTNLDWGFGGHIPQNLINKWAFYEAGVVCDQPVPDGRGGTEPRWTMAAWINTVEEARTFLQTLCSNFLATMLWGRGAVQISQDSLKRPRHVVTNGNVVDGRFTYEGVGRKAIYTVAMVTWNDPQNFFKARIETVEVPELIAKYGRRIKEIYAFGTTTRGQARRHGLWEIYRDYYSNPLVTYRAGLDHATIIPGDVVQVADVNDQGIRMGGRLRVGGGRTVQLDNPFTFTAGVNYTISVTLPEPVLGNVVFTRAITGIGPKYVDVSITVPADGRWVGKLVQGAQTKTVQQVDGGRVYLNNTTGLTVGNATLTFTESDNTPIETRVIEVPIVAGNAPLLPEFLGPSGANFSTAASGLANGAPLPATHYIRYEGDKFVPSRAASTLIYTSARLPVVAGRIYEFEIDVEQTDFTGPTSTFRVYNRALDSTGAIIAGDKVSSYATLSKDQPRKTIIYRSSTNALPANTALGTIATTALPAGTTHIVPGFQLVGAGSDAGARQVLHRYTVRDVTDEATTALSGTYETVALASALPATMVDYEAIYGIQSDDLEMSSYTVLSFEEADDTSYDIVGLRYVPELFDLVEDGKPFTEPTTSLYQVNEPAEPPSNLTTVYRLVQGPEGPRQVIEFSFDRSPTPLVTKYAIAWRYKGGNWRNVETSTNSAEVPFQGAGLYEWNVVAIPAFGKASAPIGTEYLHFSERPIDDVAVANLVLSGLTPLDVQDFMGRTMKFEWTMVAPQGFNQEEWFDPFFVDWEINVCKPDGTLLRAANTTDRFFNYTAEMALEDNNGTPLRSFLVKVRMRDTYGTVHPWTTNTFTNPPPGLPSTPTRINRINGATIVVKPPNESDLKDLCVWISALDSTTVDTTVEPYFRSKQNSFDLTFAIGSNLSFKIGYTDDWSGNLPTNISPAYTVSSLKVDMSHLAPAVQTDIANALQNASDAISDGVLTPAEKLVLVPIIDALKNNQSYLTTRANSSNQNIDISAYTTAMTNLNNYLNGLPTSPAAWNVRTGNTPIAVPATFITYLRTAIEQEQAVQGQLTADAFADAKDALSKANDAISDGVLTPAEKQLIVPFIQSLTNREAALTQQATDAGITTAKTNYTSAMTTLKNYLATLTTAVLWSSQTGNTTIPAPATNFTTNLELAIRREAELQAALSADAWTDASTAYTRADRAYSDGVLSPADKLTIVPLIQGIQNNRTYIEGRADAQGVDKTAYVNALNTLATYLATLSSPVLWNNRTDYTTVAAPDTFRTNLRLAMETEAALQAAITADAFADASEALGKANLALNDGILTPDEKRTFIPFIQGLIGNRGAILAQATLQVVSSVDYVAAMDSLQNYLATLSTPVEWFNYTGNTTVPNPTDLSDKLQLAVMREQHLQGDLAEDAWSDAGTALGKANDALSDGVLSPSDKMGTVPFIQGLLNARSYIEGRADALGVTKTAYVSAMNTLTTYLATLISPVLWSDRTNYTTIADPVTFSANLTAASRQTNEIQAALANDASTDAVLALGRANDAISDGVLTPAEKQLIVPYIQSLTNNYQAVKDQAVLQGISVSNYVTAMDALIAYLATLTTPFLWSNQAGNTTIPAPTTDFTTKLELAGRREQEAQRLLANDAWSDAGSALVEAARSTNDGILTPGEKQLIVPTIQGLTNNKGFLEGRATAQGVSAANYTAALNTLITYLATLTSPVLWSVMTGDTTIAAPATFVTNFKNAVQEEQLLQAALSKDAWDDAGAALSAAQDAVKDTILTPAEKLTLVPTIKALFNNQGYLTTRASTQGVTSTSYVNALNDLSSYLATLNSPVMWDSRTGNTTIANPASFYDKLLLATQREQELTAQLTEDAYNDAQTAIDNADDAVADNILTPSEKAMNVPIWQSLLDAQAGTISRSLGLGTSGSNAHSQYNTAVNNFRTYLAGLTTPVAWNVLTGNTSIPNSSILMGHLQTVLQKQSDLYNVMDLASSAQSVSVPNNLINSEFIGYGVASPPPGWEDGWDGPDSRTTIHRGVNYLDIPSGQRYYGQRNILFAYDLETPPAGYTFDVYRPKGALNIAERLQFSTPVSPGERIYLSCLAAKHRCAAIELRYFLFAETGSQVSDGLVDSGGVVYGGLGGNPTTMERLDGFVDIPANTTGRFIVPFYRIVCNGEAHPWGFVGECMVAKVPAGQVISPIYVPGPSARDADKTGLNTSAGFEGQGALATQDSVKPGQMPEVDYDNLVPDALMLDPSRWIGSGSLQPQTYAQNSLNYYRITGPSAENKYVQSHEFPVNGGNYYFIAGKYGMDVSSVTNCYMSVDYYSDNAGLVGMDPSTSSNLGTVATTGYNTQKSGVFMAPVGAKRGRIRFTRTGHASATADAILGEPIVQRVTKLGQSIVQSNGVILTDAQAVTSLGTAAAFANQGDLATQDQVNARGQVPSDPANLIRDDLFLDPPYWTITAGITFGAHATLSPLINQPNVVQATGNGATGQAAQSASPTTLYRPVVEEGVPYRFSITYAWTAGFTGAPRVLIYFYDRAGAIVPSGGTNNFYTPFGAQGVATGRKDFRATAAGANEVFEIEGFVTAPPGAYTVRPCFYTEWSTTQANAGTIAAGKMRFQKASALGGMVTTTGGSRVTDADAVTNQGTAAGITGQSPLAAGNGLQPSDVNNLNAAYAAKYGWNFGVGITAPSAWTGSQATLGQTADGLGNMSVTATGADPQVMSPAGFSFAGREANVIRIKARPLSASPTFDGALYYSTTGHAISGSYYKQLPVSGIPGGLVQNQWAVFEWDMTALSAGGADWVNSTITGIRVDLAASQQNWEIDHIEIGLRSSDPVTIRGIKDNADPTINNTAAGFTNQGTLATRGSVYFGSSYVTEADGGAQATLANFKTSSGTAAGIANQGTLATRSSVGMVDVTDIQRLLTPGFNVVYDGGFRLRASGWALANMYWESFNNRLTNNNGGNFSATSPAGPCYDGAILTIQFLRENYRNAGVVGAHVNFYNAADGYMGQEQMIVPAGGGFFSKTLTTAAPVGCRAVRVFIYGNGATSGAFYLSRVKLAIESSPSAFTDDYTSGALYGDGGSIDALKPGEAGANVTANNTAAGFTGQGPLATSSATESSVLNVNIPNGVNAAVDTDFIRGIELWQANIWDGNTGFAPIRGVNYSTGGVNYFSTKTVAFSRVVGTPADDTGWDIIKQGQDLAVAPIPVRAGQRIYARCLAAYWRAKRVQLVLGFYSANGTSLAEVEVGTGGTVSGGTNGEAMSLVGGFYDVPADGTWSAPVRFVAFYPRVIANGVGANPIGFISEPMLMFVSPGQLAAPGYQPGRQDPRADRTLDKTSAGFTGQGTLATRGSVYFGSSYVTEDAAGTTQATLANFKTSSGTAAGFANQGTLSTRGYVYFGSGVTEDSAGVTQATLANFKTSSGTASGIANQGGLAIRSNVYFGSTYVTETSGGAQATLANFKTSSGTAAGFANQGTLATRNNVGLGDVTDANRVLQPSWNTIYDGGLTLKGKGWTLINCYWDGFGPRLGSTSDTFTMLTGANPTYDNGQMTFQAVVENGRVGGGVSVNINFYDEFGTFLNVQDIFAIPNGFYGTFVRVLPMLAPVGARQTRVYVFGTTGRTAGQFFMSKFKLSFASGEVAFSDELTSGALYDDGTDANSLKPAQAGANVTGLNTAAGFTNQGALATRANVYFGSSYVTEADGGAQATLANFKTSSGTAAGFANQGTLSTRSNVYFGSSFVTEDAAGTTQATLANFKTSSGTASGIANQGGLAVRNNVYFGSTFLNETSTGTQATLANFKTSSGTASGIANQGTFATKSSGDLNDTTMFSYGGRFRQSPVHGAAYFDADAVAYSAGNTVNQLRPAEAGANVTGSNTAAAISNQSPLAANNSLTAGQVTNSNIGLGENAVPDSDLRNGGVGWEAGWDGGYPTGYRGGVNFPGYWGHRNVLWANKAQVTPPNGSAFDVLRPILGVGNPVLMRRWTLPIRPGERLFASVLAAIHRCDRMELFLVFLNSAGEEVHYHVLASGGRNNGGNNGDPNNFDRIGGFYDIPTSGNGNVASRPWTDARYVSVLFRGVNSNPSQFDPYVFATEPFLAKVPVGQTTWPDYKPGPNEMNFINSLLGGNTLSLNPIYMLTSDNVGGTGRILISSFTASTSASRFVITYDAGSISGLAFSTSYSVFVYDPYRVGGSVTYIATTDVTTYGNNPDYILLGRRTTVTSGGGTYVAPPPPKPPGYEECCWEESYLPTYKQIKETQVGDTLLLVTEDGKKMYDSKVDSISHGTAHCVTLVTETDIRLTISMNTPLLVRFGDNDEPHYVLAWEVHGEDILLPEVPVLDNDGFRWERIREVEGIVERVVGYLKCDNGVYAAGDQKDRYIFTHNPYSKP